MSPLRSDEVPLADQYDTVLFDLDGVVYLGPQAVPAAPPTLGALRDRGLRLGFVTNNAGRTPHAVVTHLRGLGIEASDDDVVTSAQAVAHLLADRFPPESPVLVLGAPALVDEVTERAKLRVVTSADDEPVAVVQGLAPDMTWADLCEAAAAIHGGAVWYATNTDTTRPTDRGLLPGCGAAVLALGLAVDAEPIVAGKPYPPLMLETLDRLGGKRSLFVGDRLDTDVAGAVSVGIDSLLVLSGAHGVHELLSATPDRRPTHVGVDVGALLRPARDVVVSGRSARCGTQVVEETGHGYRWSGTIDGSDAWLDAVWALAQLRWSRPPGVENPDVAAVLDQLGPRPEEDVDHE